MPAVFTLGQFRNEMAYTHPVAARVALTRLTHAGLVSAFGEAVYFNLLADKNGPSTRAHEALELVFRRPVVIVGGAALQIGGWTTQIYRSYDIAVLANRMRRSAPRDLGTEVKYRPALRPAAWFNSLYYACEHDGERVPMVPPVWAFADMLLAPRLISPRLLGDRGPLVVPPDEIDMDDLGPDEFEQVVEAMLTLGASRELAEELLAPYADRFESDGFTML